MKAIPILVLFIISLTACEHPGVRDVNSPYYRIPPGSLLVLHQQLTIPANQARVLIQNGQLKSRRDIDQYYPYCEFEILTLSEQDQHIHADQFTIYKSTKQMEFSSLPVMYASLVMNHLESRLVAYNTTYYLRSEKQPDVYRMMCLYWTDDSMDDFLTQNAIEKTLGNLFSFNIN